MNDKGKRYKNTAYIFSIILFLLIACGDIYSQDIKKIGTASAVFLKIPAGAKGIAMGSAFTSIADDGSSMFWNPGNAAQESKITLFLHHTPWLPGLTYNYLGFAFPIKSYGIIGLNIISLRTDDIEITTVDYQMGTGETYTAASTAVGITYAKKLTNRFSIGGNVKYISERIFNSNASGFAFDIGTMFITPFKNIRLGVNISNIGKELKMNGEDLNSYVDIAPNQEGNNDNIVSQLKTDPFALPIIMRIGLSYDWYLTEESYITIACDGENPNDNAPNVNLGIEYAPLGDMLFLRGGYNELFLEDAEKGLTLGAGLDADISGSVKFSMSYAFQRFEHLGDINHISLELQF